MIAKLRKPSVDAWAAPVDPWDRYWARGQLAACFGDARGCYEAVIAGLWRDFFALQPDGARLLDLATGNGSVALIAAETARASGKRFRIHAIDLADIDPLASLAKAPDALREVKFHARTPLEDTGFKARHFDCVFSQYGFEYSEMRRSTRELARITREGGLVQLVVHVQDGSVYTRSTEELRVLAELIQTPSLLDAARAMVDEVLRLERGPQPPRAAMEKHFFGLRQAYHQRVEQLQRYLGDPHYRPMLSNVVKTIEHTFNHRRFYTAQEIFGKLDEIDVELWCHTQRLQAMLDAALGSRELEKLAGDLRANGFAAVRVNPLQHPQRGLIGYCIRATRGA